MISGIPGNSHCGGRGKETRGGYSLERSVLTLYLYCLKYLGLMMSVNGRLPAGNV